MSSLDDVSAGTIAVLLGDAARPAIAAPAFRKRVSRAYARLRLLLGGLRWRLTSIAPTAPRGARTSWAGCGRA